MGRHSKQAQIEAEYGKPIREVLTDLYREGTIRSVAAELKLDNATILHWLKQLGIESHSPHAKIRVMPPQNSQLEHIIDDFILAKTVEGKTKDTIDFYRNNLYRFLWWLEYAKTAAVLKSLNTDTIRHFLYYMQTEKVRFGGFSSSSKRKASQGTVDAYWRTLQSLCKWLVTEGIIKEKNNPILKVQKPKQPKVVIPDIAKEDLIAMFKDLSTGAYDDTRNKAFLLILLDTGIRRRECLSLTMDRLNFDGGLLKVFGKGQKERFVRISNLTKAALQSYMKVRPNRKNLLWLTEKSEPLNEAAIDTLFRKLRRKYPHISKLSAHVFRHTFSIDYLRAGGDPFTLQMLGGWANLDMPRRCLLYTSPSPRDATLSRMPSSA